MFLVSPSGSEWQQILLPGEADQSTGRTVVVLNQYACLYDRAILQHHCLD